MPTITNTPVNLSHETSTEILNTFFSIPNNNIIAHTIFDDLQNGAQISIPKNLKENNDIKNKEITIQDIYKYPQLQLELTKHKKITRDFYISLKEKQKTPFIFRSEFPEIGIEVETENIKDDAFINHFWYSKEDNSLRNYGIEFTSKPLTMEEIEPALNYLVNQLSIKNKPDMSPRTSIHVHVNCRKFTWEQIKTITLLYAIFEHHFYNIVGKNRENSIFCVPLYKTEYLNTLFNIKIDNITWSKYCGINLLPLIQFGTIEFRHLYGTLDINTILRWIDNIGILIKAGSSMSWDYLVEKIKHMNSDSSYAKLYVDIFGEKYKNSTSTQLEYCISQIKRILFGNVYYQEIKSEVSIDSEYYQSFNKA